MAVCKLGMSKSQRPCPSVHPHTLVSIYSLKGFVLGDQDLVARSAVSPDSGYPAGGMKDVAASRAKELWLWLEQRRMPNAIEHKQLLKTKNKGGEKEKKRKVPIVKKLSF